MAVVGTDIMNDNHTLRRIRFLIKNLNFMIILMVSSFMAVTPFKIASSMQARDFLDGIKTLPFTPWSVAFLPFFSFLILIGLMQIKGREQWNNFFILSYGIVQLALCSIIINYLGASYNGIVLLVIADLLVCGQNTKLKISFIIVLLAMYVFSGIGQFFGKNEQDFFQIYLNYYNTDARKVVLWLKNMLVSGNNLFFMLYMIMLIRIQILENERISLLNRKLDEANEKLQRANLKLEEYAKESEKMARSMERNRLAREIHDTLGHVLTGIIAGIDASLTLMEISPNEAKKQLEVVGGIARQGIKDVRRSVNALKPDALERLSLEDAIKQIIEETKQISNAEVIFNNKADLSNLAEDETETIYRIIQESITNSLRHGKADKIQISICRVYNIITITICDNGVGCKELKKGFGLRHMAERIEMLNGSLEYKSENGFELIAKIPIRWGK